VGVLAEGVHQGHVLVLGVDDQHIGLVVQQQRAQERQLHGVRLAHAARTEDDHVGVATDAIVEHIQCDRSPGAAVEAERHAVGGLSPAGGKG
jgi:hypothetical protein